MNKASIFALAAAGLGISIVIHAAPLEIRGRPDELCVFPHSLCISDFICTGTPISTNDGLSAEFAVDEILWGTAPSTNITIRDKIPEGGNLPFQFGERYLVCAFTNDWWSMLREDCTYDIDYILSQCVTETNRPPNNAVFNDYVILEGRLSVIPFSYINYGGTNYWDQVRTFATNIIDIAKHEGDDDKVRNATISIIDDPVKFLCFPKHIRRHLRLYELYFYDGGQHRARQ